MEKVRERERESCVCEYDYERESSHRATLDDALGRDRKMLRNSTAMI